MKFLIYLVEDSVLEFLELWDDVGCDVLGFGEGGIGSLVWLK